MEADATHRYRSRILREMNANRVNPFNSPPSSTGSHGTLSPTVSSVLSDPEGESTRRLNEDIARITHNRKLPINWDAAHRKWPEFFSRPSTAPADDTDIKPLATKENMAPVAFNDDSTREIWPGSTKTRAEMQPRVENESDLSSLLARSPARAMTHRMAAAKGNRQHSPLAKLHTRAASDNDGATPIRRRPSISDALDRLRRASPSAKDIQQSRDRHGSTSPLLSSAKSSLTAVAASPGSVASPPHEASHARSFFMPDVSHLGDFVTGTLKFSGSMKNGVPIFVKHGRVHDRRERPDAAAHAHVDGIPVPESEEKIFVSMDMIRDEIISLQEHHDKVQEYAANLQQEVHSLEAQLRSRKTSAGSGYYADEKLVARKSRKSPRRRLLTLADTFVELEVEVSTLQARLDQVTRKYSDKELENVSLANERDRAVSRLQSACDDIGKLTRKLSVKEKELETTHKQQGSTNQILQDNDTLRRDLLSLKQGREALELENTSLRADNEVLRQRHKDLGAEVESLRSSQSLRHDDLADENKELRAGNKSLLEEIESLSENLEAAHVELDAAREELDALRQEKTTLQEDNESLVRHNEKYFGENKMLRRENSGFERSIHDLHDENLKLKEQVELLRQQLDHCRPMSKEDISARLDEETDENMTSAFFVPDITINTNESGTNDAAPIRDAPELPELTSQEFRVPTMRNDTRETGRAAAAKREVHVQVSKSKSRQAASGQRVAFSIPEVTTQSDKNVANKSKRRSRTSSAQHSQRERGHAMDPFHDAEDTTGLQSVDNPTQDQAISLDLSAKNQRQSHAHDLAGQGHGSQRAPRTVQRVVAETDLESAASKLPGQDVCPALSMDARRILDGLCEHNCRNCIVCTRIASHRGVVSQAELASGKKRIAIPRPVPVTDRDLTAEDPTVRPSQPPGHALALVIKGLEDESRHMQLELSRLQAGYNSSDKALGRRDRRDRAEAIRTLLKRLEVKNDQIYSLYDVLEGQKAARQAMTEEEVELTVLNITGMTVRDVTSNSENLTWEGFRDTA